MAGISWKGANLNIDLGIALNGWARKITFGLGFAAGG